MKLDQKTVMQVLKLLAAGAGAVAAAKLLQGIIGGFLLDEKIKTIVDNGRKNFVDSKKTGFFDPLSVLSDKDMIAKFSSAMTNALLLASGAVVFIAMKYIKDEKLRTAAMAGAGLPVVLGASALVDKTGRVADMLDIRLTHASADIASTQAGDNDGGVTIPAAAIVDFMNARAKSLQGGPISKLADQINGNIAQLADEINGDEDEDDTLAA